MLARYCPYLPRRQEACFLNHVMPAAVERRIKEMWEPTVTDIPYVRLGCIKFRKNDFFLARPNADNGDLTCVDGAAEAGLPEYGPPRQMWFGKVLGVVVHSR